MASVSPSGPEGDQADCPRARETSMARRGRYGPRISIRCHLRRGGGRADHDVHRRARDVRGIHDARDVHDARVRPNKTGGSKLHRSDSD
jgi:hypothetical protein